MYARFSAFLRAHKKEFWTTMAVVGLFVLFVLGTLSQSGRLPQWDFQKFFGRDKSSDNIALDEVPLYRPVADYESAVVAAVKKVSPAVVSITISKELPTPGSCGPGDIANIPPQFRDFFDQFYTTCDGSSTLQEVGGGSGFIITKEGLIITNKHVVSDEEATYAVFTNDGTKYEAKVLALDPVQDLAVLQIEGKDLPTVALGNSDDLALGQTAISIGNALAEFRNTVAVGVISGLGRSITALGKGGQETIQGVIQTDAAVNPGNSGGPLINLRGEVVGVNVAVVQGAENIAFALPINWAKRDIENVIASGKILVPWLGVRYVPVTAELAKKDKLAADHGILVQADGDTAGVIKDSPADKAGIKEGDIITAIDGANIDDGLAFARLIAGHTIGDEITLTVQRGDKELELRAKLEERQNQ